METTSLSVRVDAGVLEHNNRIFVAKNVDSDRIKDNITYIQEDIKNIYNFLFSDALKEYNSRQSQPCRKINNYLEKIKNSKQEKPFYEAIIQFGDKDDTAVGSVRGETAKKMLDEYMLGFQKRNPQLAVFNAVLHLDEATPHLHIDFVPFAKNQKQGLSTRVSLKKALAQQGFFAKSIKETERQQWALKEKAIMKTIAKKYNLAVINKNIHRTHLQDDEYRKYAQELEELKNTISALKKKSQNELTIDEMNLIRNENILLEKENEILKAHQSTMRKSFYFSSEEKLSYISEKLHSEGVDVSVEGEAIRIPEWAEDKVKKLEEAYKPKPAPWRERAKHDIDSIIYTVKNIGELWDALQKQGYEIKTGKYVSIKPCGAERFIRTKSLGIEYTLEALESRIKNNRNFESGCIAKINSTYGIEREFHIAVKSVIVLFNGKRKFPKKIDKTKPFTIKNDFHIEQLKNCLDLIKSENILSADDLQRRRERCDEKITEAKARIKAIDDMQEVIADLKEKAKLYFKPKTGAINSMLEMKLTVAKEILGDYGIKSESDLARVDETYENNQKEKSELAEAIKAEQKKLSELSELLSVYEETQSGSYIEKLIDMEMRRIEAENKLQDGIIHKNK